MSQRHHWSSKYVTRTEGDTVWVREDYVDRMRLALVASGRVETGHVLTTGGRQYVQFLLESAA